MGMLAGVAALAAGAAPSQAAYGDAANVFGKITNKSGESVIIRRFGGFFVLSGVQARICGGGVPDQSCLCNNAAHSRSAAACTHYVGHAPANTQPASQPSS